MPQKLILTSDVNLMNVDDPTVPFRHVANEFKAADVVFSDLHGICDGMLTFPAYQEHPESVG